MRSIRFHDGPGALLHFEVETKQEAEKIVRELPMVKANLVSPEFLALKPFTGLQDISGDASAIWRKATKPGEIRVSR